jgi:hypothetical protein
MDSVRQTSGVTVRAILGYVRTTGGPEAVSRTLALAGALESPETYDDTRRWWSWEFKIRLFESAAIVLDDPDVGRKIGLGIIEHAVGTPLILALSLIGGPTHLLTWGRRDNSNACGAGVRPAPVPAPRREAGIQPGAVACSARSAEGIAVL